ncbi:MAG: hypothetical protein ACLQDV_01335 [Candidatus Binataceae bacterium]
MRSRFFSLDHMTVGCVVIAGLIEAAQQAVGGAPTILAALPAYLKDGFLNYVPLTLLTIAGALWIVKQSSAIRPQTGGASDVVAQIPPDTAQPKIKEVINQTFRNQEVALDGHAYFACTFEDCVFVYNFGPTGGFGPDYKWAGTRGLKGNDPRLQHLLHFLGSLGLLNPWIKPLYTPRQSSIVSEGSVKDEAEREIHLVLNDHTHPYWRGEHPAHKEAVQRMQKLYQIAYQDKAVVPSLPTPHRGDAAIDLVILNLSDRDQVPRERMVHGYVRPKGHPLHVFVFSSVSGLWYRQDNPIIDGEA